MKTKNLKKLFVSTAAPLFILLLLAFAPYLARAANGAAASTVAGADATPPSDVENLKAAPDDGAVTLSWNVATDNVGVKGYKIYYGTGSATGGGGSYALGPLDAGNKISYKLSGLQNNQKYYFAVTAYDAAGNESVNYSLEASATPAATYHAAADNQAPKVLKAEAVSKTQVRVTFSEAVKLPATTPESAFSIKNDSDAKNLAVSRAALDPQDQTNQTVLLTTATQQAGAPYILTAGIGIKDGSGNPIISGTSDTAPFTGTDLDTAAAAKSAMQSGQSQQPAMQNQAQGPQIKAVNAPDAMHVEVTFFEPVVLKNDGRENFIISEEQNVSNTLDISAVTLDAAKTKATLTTVQQKAVKYNLFAVDVANDAGTKIDLANNVAMFTGSVLVAENTTTPPPPGTGEDKTLPEDARDFMAKMIKKLIVTLAWKGSANTVGDLANYVLYMGTDGKSYGDGIAIDPAALNFDVTDIAPKVKYFFKLTARDKAGNESQGVTTTFKLPSTGPELGLLLLGSLGLGKFLKRRKKVSR